MEENFNKIYNPLQEGKKRNFWISLIRDITAGVIVISAIVFAYSVNKNATSNVTVVSSNASPLESKTVRKTELVNSLLQSHCERTVYFINSFSRFTLKSNQTSAYFMVSKSTADKVFSSFKNSGMYNDVLQQGWEYECKFDKVLKLNTKELPYKVIFQSYITGRFSDTKKKYLVRSEGIIETITPQYPENPFGYYFTKYEQTFKKIDNE